MSDLFYSNDLLGDLERLQRRMTAAFAGFPSSLRATRSETFPPVNIGSTDDTFEIVAFAPGLDPASTDVSIDRGLLIISGERKSSQSHTGSEARRYAQERFAGNFRRVVELPEAADPDKVQARYQNGCLSITVGKRESSRPRAITVQ